MGEAHKECYLNFLAAVNIRIPLVVVDNTNISGYEIAPYYRYADVMGYDVSITKLLCKSEVAAARNLHGVPAKAIESMTRRHGSGWSSLWKVTTMQTD